MPSTAFHTVRFVPPKKPYATSRTMFLAMWTENATFATSNNHRGCWHNRDNEKELTKTRKNMDENNNQTGFPLNIDMETALGEYANLALITHSSSDFILDFARMMPGMKQPNVRSRIVLAPEHAKRLLQALQENVYKYEQTFGKIRIPNQVDRTIAPFNSGKGEA